MNIINYIKNAFNSLEIEFCNNEELENAELSQIIDGASARSPHYSYDSEFSQGHWNLLQLSANLVKNRSC